MSAKHTTARQPRSRAAFDTTVINSLLSRIAVLDQHGTIIALNKAWDRFALEQSDPVRAQMSVGVGYLTAYRLIDDDEACQIVTGIEAVLAGSQSHFMAEYLRRTPAGDRWFELCVTPLDGGTGAIVAHAEISTRKHAEITLRESEERFRSAFEHAAIGMALVGADGRWLQVNQVLCDITGYTKHELLATTFQAITHPEDRETDIARVQRALAGDFYTYQIEKRYVHKNGDTVWVQLTSLLMRDAHNQPLYFISQIQDITERKHARLALYESEERYRLIAENTGDVVLMIDEQSRLVYVSPASKRLLGYDSAALLGTGLFDLVHPNDRLLAIAGWSDAHEQNLGLSTARFRHADGSWRWLEVRSSSITQHGVHYPIGVARDVTERKQAEETLWRSEQLYRTAANNFPNGALILFDHDLRYTVAGGVGLADIGLARELMEGKTIYELFPADICELLVPDYQAALAGTAQTQEVSFLGHTYLVYTLPVKDEHGEVYAGMAMAQDITERKHFEIALMEERALLARRVEERTADLSAANAELARVARLKDEFLASMSHELRTPLNAVLGLSEALQEQVYGMLNPTQLKTLKNIEESGRHLLDLINDILDLAKIGAGKLELALGPAMLSTICHASLRLIRQDAHKKQITIETALDPAVSLIEADARRLKQVLLNLLSNAVKFTPAGGTIGLEVVGDQARQVVQLTVRDSGIGIAPEDMPRLFQPFVQLDSRLARQYNGTGLGLVLVYRMVEMHGGSISVTSEVGQGSCFTISLPWDSQSPVVEISRTAQSIAINERPAIRHVLIIEDSPTSAAQLARYLGELELTAVTYPQGEGAIDQVLQFKPDLIVLDVLLPDISGWDVLEQLKNDPRTRAIPVLIVSVMDDRAYGLTLGAAEYLLKPFTRQDVQHVLHRLIHTDRSAPATAAQKSLAPTSPIVLLAEDNEASITTTLDYLSAKGYQVVVARNGTEAIARAHEVQPALILMDIQMPGMDGLEATRRIRMQPTLIHTPIIALTALAMPGDRERCLAAGANDYLSKPVSLKGLVVAIEAQLQAHPSQQGRPR